MENNFNEFINFLNCYNIKYSIRETLDGTSKYIKILKPDKANSDGLRTVHPTFEFKFDSNKYIGIHSKKNQEKSDFETFKDFFSKMNMTFTATNVDEYLRRFPIKHMNWDNSWITLHKDESIVDIATFYFTKTYGNFIGYDISE